MLTRALALVLATSAATISRSETPVAIGPHPAEVQAIRYANRHATGGDGSQKNPWVGWESVLSGIMPDGALVEFPEGYYRHTSAAKIPPGLGGPLRIRGHGATIVLTSSTPRFLEVDKTADYQIFRNFRVEGFTIDAANLPGRESVVCCDFNGGAGTPRISYQNVTFKNLHVFNVRTDPTLASHNGFIRLEQRTTGGEPRSTYVRDVLIENVRFYGGNWGILLTGNKENPSATSYDNIVLRNVFHDMRWGGRQAQDRTFPSTCFHVGSYSPADHVTIENATCYAPGDNCVEVNNAMTAEIRDVACYNPPLAGFTLRNFTEPARVRSQVYKFSDSVVRITAVLPGRSGPVGVDSGGPLRFGSLFIQGLSLAETGPLATELRSLVWIDGGRIKAVSLENVELLVPGLTRSSTADKVWSPIQFSSSAYDWNGDGAEELPKLSLNGLRIRVNWTESRGISVFRPIAIHMDADIDIHNVSIDYRTNSNDEYTAIFVGEGPSGTVGGVIEDIESRAQGPNLKANRYLFVGPSSEIRIWPYLAVIQLEEAQDISIDPTNLPKVTWLSGQAGR